MLHFYIGMFVISISHHNLPLISLDYPHTYLLIMICDLLFHILYVIDFVLLFATTYLDTEGDEVLRHSSICHHQLLKFSTYIDSLFLFPFFELSWFYPSFLFSRLVLVIKAR